MLHPGHATNCLMITTLPDIAAKCRAVSLIWKIAHHGKTTTTTTAYESSDSCYVCLYLFNLVCFPKTDHHSTIVTMNIGLVLLVHKHFHVFWSEKVPVSSWFRLVSTFSTGTQKLQKVRKHENRSLSQSSSNLQLHPQDNSLFNTTLQSSRHPLRQNQSLELSSCLRQTPSGQINHSCCQLLSSSRHLQPDEEKKTG